MQVAEGVHRLTGGVCNFYLIEDGGKLVLVDAGAPRDWDLLVKALATLSHGLQDLEAWVTRFMWSDGQGFRSCHYSSNIPGLPIPGRNIQPLKASSFSRFIKSYHRRFGQGFGQP